VEREPGQRRHVGQVKPSLEDRPDLEHRALFVVEQVVGPLDGALEGGLTLVGASPAPGQKAESVIQVGCQFGEFPAAGTTCRQLNGQ
jgi:hypothetical protein